MGQLEDLKAAHEAIQQRLGVVAGKVDGVQADVQTLIDLLGNLPPSTDLTAAIEQANAILGQVNAVADDLDTTPKPPTP